VNTAVGSGGRPAGANPTRRSSGPSSRRPTRTTPPRGFRRLRWALSIAVVAGVVLVAYLGVTFAQVWRASQRDGARSADAIVVLGAAQYDCHPSPVLQRRLDHALVLYGQGRAPVIVVTGGKQAGDRCTEAETSAEYLQVEGVPSSALLLEADGTNSWESLVAAADLLHERGETDVVLVTDGYHALRVNAIADELGLQASVSPSGGGGSVRDFVEETGAVAVGRIIGFGRLVDIDDQIDARPGRERSRLAVPRRSWIE
jgi:uncharacterized SAM-binding protein YcdF (DUF218 family)